MLPHLNLPILPFPHFFVIINPWLMSKLRHRRVGHCYQVRKGWILKCSGSFTSLTLGMDAPNLNHLQKHLRESVFINLKDKKTMHSFMAFYSMILAGSRVPLRDDLEKPDISD